MKPMCRRSVLVVVALLFTLFVLPGSFTRDRALAGPPGADTVLQGLQQLRALRATDATLEPVLIRQAGPHGTLLAMVRNVGGKVVREFKHFDAVAVQVPRSALPMLGALVGQGAITKDLLIPAPRPMDLLHARSRLEKSGEETRITFDSARGMTGDALAAIARSHPDAYALNNAIMNVTPLLARGISGEGVIVAVIDSGIRPGFPHLESDGSVIGGEDLVGDGLGYSNASNSGHGTFVAGMISANVQFQFNVASTIFRSIMANAPSSVIPPDRVPMVGTAPLSSIYAIRIFPPFGGAPVSVVLAAMDRVLELREKYDAGEPGGLKIQVVNMSLSGPTLFAGRDLLDTAVSMLLDKDIVVVCSAGNSGPSGMTVGSPATSTAAITTGAANLSHNERILRDLQFGLGVGNRYRPSGGPQIAYFSSRGPDADGRSDPDVIANGFASFGQGFSGTSVINLASGTSFSAPTVAGIAALLRQAFPGATARDIRAAILKSANPALLVDGSTALDQGSGFVDAQAAYDILAAAGLPATGGGPGSPGVTANADKSGKSGKTFKPGRSVLQNVQRGAGLSVAGGSVLQHVGPLVPGQRREILYNVLPDTERIIVMLSNFAPELPPGQQNPLFGDDFFITIHSAKTSNQPGGGDYFSQDFTLGGTFMIYRPERGLLRVTLNGDWTNAGSVSGDVAIEATLEQKPRSSARGKIAETQTDVIPFDVPDGAEIAEFQLIWKADWSDYPTNDVDLILVDPFGDLYFDGATLSDPERVLLFGPVPGRWYALVNGFELHTSQDDYNLSLSVDGYVVKPARN